MQEIKLDETTSINENQTSPNILVEDLSAETTKKTTESHSMKAQQKKKFIFFALIAIIAGVLTGYGSTQLKAKSKPQEVVVNQVASDTSRIKNGDVFGVQDKATFADNAQGYVEAGGVDGEGSHRLLRIGGETQTVALTSSVADLDDFVGMEIKIWGETNKAQVSGWFMDVGRIEVINTEAESPIQSLD